MTRILEREEDLRRLIESARTIAVVGMRDEATPEKPAYLIPRMLLEHGFTVIPVNPKITASLGQKAWPNLAAYGKAVDLVNVFRLPAAVGPLADEILTLPPAHRPKAVWMQSGIRNAEAARKLVAAGIEVVMDACLGVYVSRYR